MPTQWSKSFVTWQDDGKTNLSVVFTWDLPKARRRAEELKKAGVRVCAGGPAVALMPEQLADVAEIGESANALPHHNPNATFTSRGCPRNCGFCAVPKIEGPLKELDTWPVRPIVCDNNLLACSRRHFDRVIDSLKPLKGIDFNQGLDARLLTKYHAERLAELDCTVRLAWDHINLANQFMTAYERLRRAKIPKSRIRVYVLIGYKDTPEDAWFRLRTVEGLGITPNPMRYQALGSLKRNEYVGPNWTSELLVKYMRYWARLQYTRAVPFEEWLSGERPQPKRKE